LARTQSQHYPEVRQNILKKAARLFAEQGYAGTTIVDLADACASSRGALYHYFESKEDILFHILDGHVKDLLERVEQAAAGGGEPEEQCRAIITAIVLTNSDSHHEEIVLLNQIKQLNPHQQVNIKAKERKITDFVTDALIRVDKQRRLTPRTKKVYTMMLFGIINYTYTWYDPKGPVSPQEFADIAADLFIRGFTANVV
jgi:AcrR family transcriptional regulator